MLNATNMLGKDKSALETIKAQAAYGAFGLTGPGRRRLPRTRLSIRGLPIGAAFRSSTGSLAGWLASHSHRIGARLFAMNDTEARWRGWDITELHCGLSRSYRDPRFDLLRLLRTLDPPTPAGTGWPGADRPKVVRPLNDWDDVHGWPCDGEG